MFSIGVVAFAALSPGLLVSRPAIAPHEGEPRPSAHDADPALGMPDAGDAECDDADLFGGTRFERAAWCLAKSDVSRFASVRTLATKALADDPTSYRALYLLGVAQHQGESNLPKALRFLELADARFVERHGEHPEAAPDLLVLQRILLELLYVHGEMDHHEEKIRAVEALRERAGIDYRALTAWPLMKLGRFSEARVVASEAMASENWLYRAVGLTALCAIESEMQKRMAAYTACTEAARPMLSRNDDGAVELSNAGAASEEMFRFDEAERYFVEATRRPPEGSANPWGRLVRLYARQGRFAEAVSAWREMRAYRNRRPVVYLDQQDQSDADLTGAAVLILAGRAKEALPITERTVARPDRQGMSSSSSEQNEAGAAIMDRVARLEVARRFEEDASASSLMVSIPLRLRAAALRFEAWVVGRRVARVLSDPERLGATLRPECPGSLEVPTWFDPEVIDVVGAGVALASIERTRSVETLPFALADPVFAAYEAEAFLVRGDAVSAFERAAKASTHLPESERLLRARVSAIGAEAARRLGKTSEVVPLLLVALQHDPGVVRRLGLELPVVFVRGENHGAVDRAIDLLEASPLFAEEPWGLRLVVRSEVASLETNDGSELIQVRVPAAPLEDDEARARRIVHAIHADILVPNVDITQADIRSLDGSLGTGGRASERVESVFREMMNERR